MVDGDEAASRELSFEGNRRGQETRRWAQRLDGPEHHLIFDWRGGSFCRTATLLRAREHRGGIDRDEGHSSFGEVAALGDEDAE